MNKFWLNRNIKTYILQKLRAVKSKDIYLHDTFIDFDFVFVYGKQHK